MHHARWLAKAIYCLKIYMFRNQFVISASDLRSLREICVFIVTFYVKIWFTASKAIQAPYSDLELFKSLIKYKQVHPKVAEAALDKLSNHCWYLHEQLACLALFDETVTQEEKLKIIYNMKNKDSTTTNYDIKRLNVTHAEKESKNISDFVSKESIFIFKQFKLSYDFINDDFDSWDKNASYQECLYTFSNLRVVNDTAERGVALMEEFNNCLTNDEEQRQYLLQVVQNHRKNYSTCFKSNYKLLSS